MQDINNYIQKVENHTLPRWEQLPDFELYMDQVISLMQKYLEPYILTEDALTPSMINNYVKMEALPAPSKKRYSKEHISRLIIICLMKNQFSIPTISNIINAEIVNNEIIAFYNYFVTQYEMASKDALKQLKEHTIKGALSLAIGACANYTTAQYTVNVLLPPEEKKADKKAEKEKKDKKPEKEKKDKKDKKSSEK
jgi:DNA-binding transcriptional MerR regulator